MSGGGGGRGRGTAASCCTAPPGPSRRKPFATGLALIFSTRGSLVESPRSLTTRNPNHEHDCLKNIFPLLRFLTKTNLFTYLK